MRIILSILLNAVALIITAKLVPQFDVTDFATAILAAIVLGVINTFIKPVLIVLTLPLTILTLGLFSFVVNAFVLYIAAWFVKGIVIESFIGALLAALVLSIVSTALSMLLHDLTDKK